MSRQFNGAGDQVTFSPGTATFGQGPITIAALIKPTNTGGTREVVGGLTGGAAETYGLLFDSGDYYCVNLFTSGRTVTNNDWQWIVMTKATGSVTPRWHFRDVTTAGAWVHSNAGGNANNGSSPTATLYVGGLNGSRFLVGFIAALAVWGTELNDAQVEAACTLAASDLNAAAPTWATLWNQASVATPVPDFTGNGGNQTAISGTSVSADDPPGFNYALSTTVVGTAAADLGALGASAAGRVTHSGTAIADLGALNAAAVGTATGIVTGVALADLGRLNAIADTQLPDPDQYVSALMNKLLECLCTYSQAAEGAPAHCCFRVGTEIAHDAGMLEDLCCEGIAYVSLGETYPSSESFPEADIVRQANSICAPATWAQSFQVGIIRCAPVGNGFVPPGCTDWNAAARQNIIDAKTLRQVACCMRDFVVNNEEGLLGMSLIIERQLQGNPQGGCVERTMKLTAQFPNSECSCP